MSGIKNRNPWIAAILSFLVIGLGQVYNGEYVKAFIFFVLGLVFFSSMLFLIGFILWPVLWIVNIVDAYVGAGRVVE